MKPQEVEKILQAFQDKYHVIFRDQSQVRKLIVFIRESLEQSVRDDLAREIMKLKKLGVSQCSGLEDHTVGCNKKCARDLSYTQEGWNNALAEAAKIVRGEMKI